MVLPLGDDNSDRTIVPFLNYALIVVNFLVFVFLQGIGSNEQFTYAFSTVPMEIVENRDLVGVQTIPTGNPRQPTFDLELQPTPITPYITLLTSMFMHGSIMHILGNMLFLAIFGDNLEDRLGRARYLLFYLLTGIIASLAHVASTYAFKNDPRIPSLGASGAISGVLAGYVVLFPTKRVTVMLGRMLTHVPAYVAVGLWFAFQVLEGLASMRQRGGGVAYGAHIGGFLAGFVLILPFVWWAGQKTSVSRSTPGRYREPW